MSAPPPPRPSTPTPVPGSGLSGAPAHPYAWRPPAGYAPATFAPAGGQPPWWTPPRPTHPAATRSLVLGLAGLAGGVFLLLPLLCGPLAWYQGAVALREVERDPARWSPGPARAGLVLGIITTAALLFVVLVTAALAGFAIVAATATSPYAT